MALWQGAKRDCVLAYEANADMLLPSALCSAARKAVSVICGSSAGRRAWPREDTCAMAALAQRSCLAMCARGPCARPVCYRYHADRWSTQSHPYV